MAVSNYRVTLDGGIKAGTGSLAATALTGVRLLAEGKAIYVRCTTDDSRCVKFVRGSNGIELHPTWWGEPCPAPEWANQLRTLLSV